MHVISKIVDAASDPSWVNAASTVIIMIFTVVLGAFTISLARSTRIAANAAALSANAAIRIELPVLRVRGSQIEMIGVDADADPNGPYGGVVIEGLPTQHTAISDIEVKNFGRTSAFPVSVALGYSAVERLPPKPIYQKTVLRPEGSVIEKGETGHMEVHFGIHLTDSEFEQIRSETVPLWFYFSISFRDFMGDTHEARFCFKWARPDGVGAYYFSGDRTAPAEYTKYT